MAVSLMSLTVVCSTPTSTSKLPDQVALVWLQLPCTADAHCHSALAIVPALQGSFNLVTQFQSSQAVCVCRVQSTICCTSFWWWISGLVSHSMTMQNAPGQKHGYSAAEPACASCPVPCQLFIAWSIQLAKCVKRRPDSTHLLLPFGGPASYGN